MNFQTDPVASAIALASLAVTVFIAVVIQRFTKKIEQVQALRETANGWAHFSTLMLIKDNFELFNNFFEQTEEYDGADRQVHYLIYIYLNNIHAEWSYIRNGIMLNNDFSVTGAYLPGLARRKTYILDLMRHGGYEAEFVKYIADA